jgi:protocatechuate 3,4-dioxygenase beta subunit
VVLRGTLEPVAGAKVVLLTDCDSIDFPETVERLAGSRSPRRLVPFWELDREVAALGGWRPAHAATTTADGRFLIRVPPSFPAFRFEVTAEHAVYLGGDRRFALGSPDVEKGLLLEVDSAGSIEGTVLGPHGEPRPGATVLLVPDPSRFSRAHRMASTDGEGEFRFDGVPPALYGIGVGASGCAPSYRGGVEVRAGATARVHLRLGREGSISGIVVDREGNPLSRVTVRASAWATWMDGPLYSLASVSATTGEDGKFRLESLGPATHDVVVGFGDSVGSEQTLQVHLAEGEALEGVRIVVDARGEISGRVLDAEGFPMPEATVLAWTDALSARARRPTPGRQVQRSVRTDEEGRFSLRGLHAGPLFVEATAEGRGGARLDGVDVGAKDLVLVLPGPTGVEGVVRDAATGDAVRRFEVTQVRTATHDPWELYSFPYRAARSFDAPDGSFVLSDLVAGSYGFAVDADGYQPGGTEGGVAVPVLSGSVVRGLEIALEPAPRIRGRVIDGSTGLPVEGAWVSLSPSAQSRRADGRTRSDGRFDLQWTSRFSSFRLHAVHPDYARSYAGPFDVKDAVARDGIEIALSRGGDIDGFAPRTDAALPAGTRVLATWRDGGFETVQEAEVDPSGYFRIDRLAPGTHGVELVPQGVSASVEVVEGETRRVEFPPPAAVESRVVRGRVTRVGEPVGGARVRWLPQGSGSRTVRTASTGSDGTFEIRGVDPGEAIVAVDSARRSWGDEVHAYAAFRVEVPPGPAMDLNLALPTGVIEGRVVRDSDGAPLSEVGLAVRRLGPAPTEVWCEVAGVRTDDEGRFRVLGLAPGDYEVSAAPHWLGTQADLVSDWPAPGSLGGVRVAEGATVAVTLALPPAGTAVVEAVDASGSPVPNVSVSLVPAGDEAARTRTSPPAKQTDAQGRAVFRGLREGRYEARASHGGMPVRSETYLVVPRAETVTRLVLP